MHWSAKRSLLTSWIAGVVLTTGLHAQTIVQEYYVPMPEAQIRQSFLLLAPNTGTTMDTVVSMVVGTSGTRMVYDHWEDGYEVDINNPSQASTQVWGDGNDANGKPPGYAQDPTSLDAGTVIALRNNVSLPRNPSSILYDGRDRVGSTKGVVMSRSSWATTPGSVLADATEVSATIDWGKTFVMPVGENEIFPTPATSSMFELVSIFIQASQNGTVVQLDKDGNGSVDTTVTLNQGETYYLDRGILKGATVTASKPVQVDLLTGDIGANYESRWYTVAPLDQWGSSYYTPVGTANDGDDTYIFLYNPDPAAITVNYTTRSSTGSFVIPAKDSYRFLMPQDSGAHFFNAAGKSFFAIGTVGAKPTANNVHDWGFSLVPEGNLTTSIVCGWGPGSSDLSANGSPVWATAVANTRIYVDYGGDYVGSLTDPEGDNYDVHYDISALEVKRLYDTSKDQTGMRVYTLDGTLITGAWGQDPAVAGPGNPYLDAGTTIPAFPVPVITKSYTIFDDVGAPGLSIGDTLEYTITMNNNSLVALGNLFVVDAPPPSLTYVAGTTTRDAVTISDNLSPSTTFPLDKTGIIIPVLPRGQVTTLKYRMVINAGGSITNTVSTSYRGVSSSAIVVVPGGSSPCTINFTNSGGTTVSTYNEGNGIYIQMSDPDANTNSSTIQTVTVLVKNTTNGDLEYVTLTETSASSGIFRNTSAVLPSSPIAGLAPYDGTLNALSLNNLYVSYTDPIYGDSANATATIIAPGLNKQLYLSTDGADNDNTGALDRVDPVATADASTSQTAILGSATIAADSPSSSTSTVFTSTPVSPAYAAVSSSSGSASSFTFSHTPGTGTNRLLLVGVTLRNNASQTVSSVTFGGAALTRVGTQANGSNARVEIWRLINPSSAAANVVVTLDASAQASIGATTFTGVDQTTPLEAFNSNTGSSTTPAVGVTAASDQLVFDTVALNANATSLTVASGQTRRWNVQQSTTLIGASSTKAGAASVTTSWTGTTGPWAIGAVAIRSAGSTVSLNHTTGSGSNRLMLVGLSYEDDDGDGFKVSSVSYAGLPLTRMIQRASAVEAGSEIWYLINPPSGAGTVTVATAGAGATDDEIVVGVSTFSGVNQATPFGTAVSEIGSTGPATVNVASASGELVFDTVALDDSRKVTVGSGQTQQWNLNTEGSAGDGVSGAGSTKPGASSVTMSWTLTANDDWAICAVPIKPASGTPVTFTQTPAFAEAFSLTTVPSVTAYYSVSSGTMPASPAISAVLRKNGVPFATSSGATASGGLLTFTFPVSPTNFVANDVISLVITSSQSGVTFRLDYDSTTKPSKINLPTDTVIHVDSVGVYDSPYPGGMLTTTPANGQTLYVRTVVGDPFGAYDITSLPLSIDGPGAAGDISVTLGASNVVATTAASKTYEYVWNTGSTTGNYTIAATGKEGFENTITSQRSTSVNMSFLDLGTPSTTEFTIGNNGTATNTYNPNVSVGVRVTDIDKNKLPGVVETITAVITSSSGDSELVTMTETGPDTGVFTYLIPASATVAGTSNNGTLYAPQGSALTVNYVDPEDSSDTSSANATVPLPTGTPGVSVSKTLLAPSDGQAVIGEAVQYRLRVVNTGTTTLSSVSLTDSFPASKLTYVSASATPNTVASGSLIWTNVGPLTPGQSVSITVNFTALASGNPVTNSATANAGGGVTSTSNTNVIITRPGVTVTKTLVSPNPGPANKGDNVVFNINVNNTGDTPISSLPLEDIYSGTTFEFVSASLAPDSTGSGSLLWLDITGAGSLAAGSNQNITVTLKATGAASPATNRAEVSYAVDSNGDPVPPSISTASLVTTAGSILGSVLEDKGAAGFGGGDTALSGVTVTLYTDPNGDGDPADGTLVAIATSQTDGSYEFLNLALGNYTVVETDPFGYASIADTQGANDNRIAITLTSSIPSTGNNFLDKYIDPALYGNISGQVRNDTDADGDLLGADAGISGVTIDLYTDPNGDGNPADGVLYTTTLTNGSGNYSFINLPPGSYVVAETDPAGFASTADKTLPNDNRIPVTVAASQTSTGNDFLDTSNLSATGTIGNLIWSDTNNNGTFDSGETGINGVLVQLYRSSQTPGVDVPYKATTTSGGGIYSFANVPADSYNIYIPGSNFSGGALQSSLHSSAFTVTADNQQDDDDNGIQSASGQAASSPVIMIAAGETDITVDFGFVPNASMGVISGTVLEDTNNDDAGDVGIETVSLTLYTDPNGDGDPSDGVLVNTTTTAGDGSYAFASLPPGNYVVVETQPSGFLDVSDSDGGLDSKVKISLPVAGSAVASFVEERPATITGHLYIDTNGNGTQDSGEPDLAGVDVIVTDSNGNPQTVTTNSTGDWTASVPPGSTSANVDETDPQYPTGYTQTEGSDPSVITAVAGTSTDAGTDGYYLSGSLSGMVLADTDNDGNGDVPLAGVLIYIRDGVGALLLDGLGDPVTATTLADGTYSFGNLPPGDYCVHQVQPVGYNSVSDTDGINNNIIGDENPIVVTAGNNTGGNDFVEIELGVISGYVGSDTDQNGSGETALPGVLLNLLDGTGNPVLDGLGAPIQVATDSSGFYSFTQVPVGSYRVSQTQPAGYGSVSDVDGVNNNVIGDETPITMSPGLVVTGRDFVEIEFGAISGRVFKDTNDDGSGDTLFPGVILTLLDAAGDPVDADSGTPGVQPVTATTGIDGSYRFENLYPADYQVLETQPVGYGSVSDADGGDDPDLIGNITVNPGQEVSDRDFTEIELGNISGYVRVGLSPLSGVTITLLDEFGDPVDGDPGTPGIQPVTTTTNGSGFYSFPGVTPGSYQIGQTQPYGYDSVSDIDGGDANIIGDVTLVGIAPGQTSTGNNFTETVDTCPDDWDQWKYQHPTEAADGNPDADAYDNFAEFAFAMPYDKGTGSPSLGNTAWVIQPSVTIPGTLEGVFVRPKGALLNVTYTLQYAAMTGNPTVWQSVLITPLMYDPPVDNGDCTETVTIRDLEILTGLTGGKGLVRIQADLDDDGGGNGDVDHTSHTETEGWTVTDLDVCCRTYNNPYQHETAFTGTVTEVNGQVLSFAMNDDLGTLLVPGASYYLEVSTGANEGHRFDIISATGNTVTLAMDGDLHSAMPPFNTLTGAAPADLGPVSPGKLVGDLVTIHRHRTLDELFPPLGFGATGSQSDADQFQVFAGGSWTIYWLYDEGDADPDTARWVDAADSGMADKGATVIPPGQGMFFNKRDTLTSIMAYGEIRQNDFIRPHAAGNNLVGGGYPVDQAINLPLGRGMSKATGFFASTDFKKADSVFVWKADANLGASGYDTYYLLGNIPARPTLTRWVTVGDVNIFSQDSAILLLGNRSVFTRTANELPAYKASSPWGP